MNAADMRGAMAQGQVMYGLGTRLARNNEIASIAKSLGFHWLFVDMEHSPIDLDAACQISVGGIDAGVVPLVRVPGHQSAETASRLLDCGAGGIVVPHVDSVEAIMPFVQRCRFAPVGRRSMGGLLPQLGFQRLPTLEAMRLANERSLLCAMIESPQAVANAEALAAVDGVDMLLFGTNDLAIELGIPGQLADERIEQAYRTVIAAATKHGKAVGLGGIYTPELLRRYMPLGFHFALLGSDLFLLGQGADAQIGLMREITGRS
jgi:4-hydroxy-2-oxoheptanedioate aldolase